MQVTQKESPNVELQISNYLIINLFTAQGRFLGLGGVYINKYSYLHSNITWSIFLYKNNDVIQKIMSVTDKVVAINERRLKQNYQRWFDGKIADEIENRNKLFQKSKKPKLRINKDIK